MTPGPISDLDLGASAAAIADDLMARMAANHSAVRTLQCEPLVHQLLNATWPINLPTHLPKHMTKEVQGYVTNAARYALWRGGGRTVFAMHPSMVEELADSTSGSLPTDIFDLLPYTNPLVVFPEPVLAKTVYSPAESAGVTGRIVGFMVYGCSNASRNLCSSHDDSRESLGLTFYLRVCDPSGREVGTESVSALIPLSGTKFSVEDVIDKTLSTFNSDVPEAFVRTWLRELLRLAINALLYLCTEDADVQRAKDRRAPKKKNKGTAKRDSVTMLRVGWRMGPALARLRRQAAARFAAGTGSGQPTHQRRCHFRTYWVGPGRLRTVLRFIKPYWVRLDRIGDPECRVVPVRGPQRRAPSTSSRAQKRKMAT